MKLAYDPIAEAAGLHPNWRKLHLNHIRQARGFMRAHWNRHRRADYLRMVKRAQQEAAEARGRYLAATQGVLADAL